MWATLGIGIGVGVILVAVIYFAWTMMNAPHIAEKTVSVPEGTQLALYYEELFRLFGKAMAFVVPGLVILLVCGMWFISADKADLIQTFNDFMQTIEERVRDKTDAIIERTNDVIKEEVASQVKRGAIEQTLKRELHSYLSTMTDEELSKMTRTILAERAERLVPDTELRKLAKDISEMRKPRIPPKREVRKPGKSRISGRRRTRARHTQSR